MSIEEYKEKYCQNCESDLCKLVYNTEHKAQCINYEKQNSNK